MQDRHVIIVVDEIYHYGVPEMEWGKRRWQNQDGSLTPAGRIHYGVGSKQGNKEDRKFAKTINKANSGSNRAMNKLLKSVQMKRLIDDDELKKKYAKSKIASDKWFEKSKGEDFDAFDPDENGYDKNYGITTKEFENIKKLNDERHEAQKDYIDSIHKKAKDFIDLYNENAPINESIKSLGHDHQAEYWLSNQMQKAIDKDLGYSEILKQEKKRSENKDRFNQARKDIQKEGMLSWWRKHLDDKNADSFFEYVWDTQGKTLDKWFTERDNTNIEDGSWDRLQQKYAKQLAKDLGLPQTKETYSFLSDWFVNGDD